MRRWQLTLCVWCLACVCSLRPALGQTQGSSDTTTTTKTESGAPASQPSAATSEPAAQSEPGPESEEEPQTPRLESVKQEVLERYKDTRIEVQGIIGDFIDKPKGIYWFYPYDGSKVRVVAGQGHYPDVPQTTWLITATVAYGGKDYYLQEIPELRQRVREDGEGLDLGGNMPFIIAGVVLILAAIITAIVMVSRNRTLQREQERQASLQSEQEQSRQRERGLEERLRRMEMEKQAGGPGGTMVDGGEGSGDAPKRVETLMSLGKLEATSGPHAGAAFPLAKPTTVIGREEGDVILAQDGSVSRRHAIIVFTNDGRILYKDESSNGSRVNGESVHQAQREIKSGDTIEVGVSTLTFTSFRAAVTPGAVPSPPPAAESSRRAPTLDLRTGEASKPSAAPTGIHYGAEFEVVRGPDEGERFPISKPVTTLGRFDDRDIQLTDSTISRKHATLTVEGNQFILRNESDRGTEVGGEAIESRALQNGDEIEMGGTVLRFHRV